MALNEREALPGREIISNNSNSMDETTKILKSCIVARQGGVPQEQLDDEYFKFTGSYIPYLSLGYNSLYQFLGDVKELVKKRDGDNKLVYTVVEPKTAHIASMVERQKNPFSGIQCTKTYTRSYDKEGPRRNAAPKRKATKDLERGRRNQKRRKQDSRNRLREWNQVYDFESYSEKDIEEMSDFDRWFDDEYDRPVTIFDRPQKLNVVCEPLVNDKQLIGDDFFLQLAIRNVGTSIWRNGPCTALNSGLCKSGQTIRECTRTLRKVKVMTNKLVIMLGAEDIYKGHSSDKMIQDMEELLEYLEYRFAFSRSAITLCTLPPLANLSMSTHRNQVANLRRFNSWIREQTHVSFGDSWNSNFRYNLIDFNQKNTTVRGTTDYEFFQLDARMVSGTSHPYVLWSLRGRRLAMNLLRAGS